jgi:RNA polymerase sigma factor (sigma-70 family)
MGLLPTRPALPTAPLPPLKIEGVFREHLHYIAGSLSRFGVRDQDVEDASQEVLRALLRSLSTFDPSLGEARPWLYGVAFRQARIFLRRAYRRHEQIAGDASDFDAVPDPTPNPEEQMMEHERREHLCRVVREVLDTIELNRRAVLIAVDLDGMSLNEVAWALEVPVNTAKKRLHTARAEMRERLARRLAPEERRSLMGLPLVALLTMPKLSEEMRARLWEYVRNLQAQDGVTMSTDVPPDAPEAPANDNTPAALRVSGLPPLLGPRSLPGLWPFLLGGLLGGAGVFALDPRPPPTIAAAHDVITAAAPVAAAPAPALASAAPTAASEPSAAPSAELASEPQLLDRAERALDRGDRAEARATLERYARAYPRAKMAWSREVLWVRLLLLEGKRGDAETRVEALRKAAPDSPALKTLDALLSAKAAP